MKNIFLISFVILLSYSCNNDKISYLEIERSEKLKNGEWLSKQDSTSGIATVKKSIGFFKHMQLTSDSIYYYKIIDSIKIVNTRKDTLNTFLKWTSPYNNKVFYYELIEYDSNYIKIKHLNKQIKTYTYLTKRVRKERDSILKNRLKNHPSFKDSICKEKQERCFSQNFHNFLNSNIDDSFLNNSTNSTENSSVEFILNKNGEIDSIKIDTKNILLKTELFRLLKSLPLLSSGTFKNSKVNIKYSFPFYYSAKENKQSNSKHYTIGPIYLEKIYYE
jgi:hypothetical protein